MAMTAAELKVKIGADTGEAERGMQSVSERLTNLSQNALKTGGMLTAGITVPVAGIAKAALDMAVDYESAMNMLQAVSGATDEQMQQVAQTAKALGADLTLPATSASDAATAMVELAKAGLSVEQSMAAAKGVLQLSAAGNLSNAAAAEIAANALNAFGLSGERAADVANLLAAAANASSAEVTDVADSLKMASAVFASAGIPIEELIASIAQMANAGIKGSDAGTSLKQMLLSLQAPTDTARALMDGLGISIYDAQGAMLPWGDIINQFSTVLATLTQEERNAALATIFGSDAVRAANIVLMGGVEAHNEMLDAVTREGAAAELAGARMKGLGGALQGLQSQIETVLLELAEPFLGTLEGWARGLADLVPKITELDPNLRNAALAFLAVLAAAGPVLLVVGALSAALSFLLSPIGLVIAAVAALAAAYASNFLGIRDLTDQVVATIGGLLANLADYWTNTLLPAITIVWAFVSGELSPLMRALGNVTLAIVLKTSEALAGLWQHVLQPAIVRVWDAIQLMFPALGTLSRMSEDTGNILQWLKDSVLNPLWDTFRNLAGQIGSVTNYLTDMADRIHKLSLPSWLTPGSPTPFELGLRGIADAMSTLGGLSLPQLQVGLARLPSAAPLPISSTATSAMPGELQPVNLTFNLDGESITAHLLGSPRNVERLARALERHGLLERERY